MRFDLDKPYGLDPAVSLRREAFGGLAYNHATRRLSFLRSPLLVRILEQLADAHSAREALERAGVPDERRLSIETALASLLTQGMIRAG